MPEETFPAEGRSMARLASIPKFTALDRVAVAADSVSGRLVSFVVRSAILFAMFRGVRAVLVGDPMCLMWFVGSWLGFPLSALVRRGAKLWAAYDDAVDANAIDATKAFRALLGGKRTAFRRVLWLRLDGDAAFLEERWQEASQLYAELRKRKPYRDLIDPRFALAMAMDGHTHEALEFARAAFVTAKKMRRRNKREKRTRTIMEKRARRSLGAVLSLAGEHHEALGILIPLTSKPLPELPRYFAGASLAAVGRIEEATTLLHENAIGDSTWAKLSRELLEKLAASPHRGTR